MLCVWMSQNTFSKYAYISTVLLIMTHEEKTSISIKSLKWTGQEKHKCWIYALTQMYWYVSINLCVHPHIHSHPHMNTCSLINDCGDCIAPRHPFRDRLPVIEYVWHIQISPAHTHAAYHSLTGLKASHCFRCYQTSFGMKLISTAV